SAMPTRLATRSHGSGTRVEVNSAWSGSLTMACPITPSTARRDRSRSANPKGTPKSSACPTLSCPGKNGSPGPGTITYRTQTCPANRARSRSQPSPRHTPCPGSGSLVFTLSRSLLDSLGHRLADPWVEHARDDVGRVALVIADDVGQSHRGGEQHLVADVVGLRVDQTAEDSRKDQHVVDLVGKVAAAGRDDGRVLRRLPGVHLWLRVRHRKDDRVIRHGGDVVAGEDA